jgi:hypothetical protein
LNTKTLKKGSHASKTKEAKPEFGKITHEKIINSDQLLTVIPLSTNDKTQNSRILLLKIDNEIKSVTFSMYPEKNSPKERFSGKILIHNLDGDFINGFRVKNGHLISQFVKSDKIVKNSLFNKEVTPTELNEVLITNNYHNTYYFNFGYFQWYYGGSGFETYFWDYEDGYNNEFPPDVPYVSVGGGVDPTSCQLGYIKDQYGNCVLDTQIITTDLPPCVDKIVVDIKTLQNGKFAQVIAKFAGVNPAPTNYNWNISTGVLPTDNPGSTNGTVGINGVNTTLNENDLNVSTDLSIAKTLIHECFHAYLVSVYRYRDIDKSYVNLIETYFTEFNKDLNDAQHNIFADTNIIKEISSAIQEYGVSKGYVLSQQFYDDMAWGGLAGTKAFKTLSDEEQERILDVITAEYKNSSNNSLNLSPKGKKACL